MNKMDEIILAAPRSDVFQNEMLTFQGVNSEDERIIKIMAQIEAHFLKSEEATRKKTLDLNSRFRMSSSAVMMRYLCMSGSRAEGNRASIISFLSASADT